MLDSALKQAFLNLPEPNTAIESIVSNNFIPKLIEALGYSPNEQVPQFPTGSGSNQKVDFALRQNTDDDIFLHSQKNPFIIIEVKGRDIKLNNNRDYKATVQQIKRYLSPKAFNCQTAQWGLITNADYIQLFRKHGRVVYPVTQLIQLTPDNIDEKVEQLKQIIHYPNKALTVTIYNNKGGVGKTTTVLNLAAYLGIYYKVLVIDFDANQKDLTQILNINQGHHNLYECLRDYKTYNIEDAISPYRITDNKNNREVGFDVIPADETFIRKTQNQLLSEIKRGRLYNVLQQLKDN